MRKTSFMVLVALAVLAAAACKDTPTAPIASSRVLEGTKSTESGTTATIIKVADLIGTWQATKAEGTNYWDPNIRRDLVAEGGTVTLVLEANQTYTVTLTMPGESPRADAGRWYLSYNKEHQTDQIDFWTSSIPIDELEYGDGAGFYITLSGNTLTLSEGGGGFVQFDFGWHDADGNDWARLVLVLTR